MKKFIIIYFIIIFIAPSCRGERSAAGDLQSEDIRKPVFAGQFYPADPKVLGNTLKSFFDQAKKPMANGQINPKTNSESNNGIVAIIVPHAGYVFSGQIAADAFSQVRNNHYDLIVVLGTNHTSADFSGISIYPKSAFGTPIGDAAIDESAAEALLKEDPSFTTDLNVHAKEHSIEVQIPFIKYLFPEAKILPVIVSGTNIGIYTRFGRALAKVLKAKKALVVASSDLSHYPKFDDAIKTDSKTLKAIASLDEGKISSEMRLDPNIPELVTCACGEAPILAAVACAKELGAAEGSIVSYSNSGYNPLGDVNKVVGYGAVAISRKAPSSGLGIKTSKSEGQVRTENQAQTRDLAQTRDQTQTGVIVKDEINLPADESNSAGDFSAYRLTASDKEQLLEYARKTLSQYFWTQTVPLPRDGNSVLIKMKRGAFVTLRLNGELRGCIGHMTEDVPLHTIVGTMALHAAFNDSRFDPLSPVELPKIRIEISVLTPFTLVKNADEITLGRDGVVLKKGDYQAVFLPQVATETGWNKQMLLDQLCYKAGLKANDWKDAELYTFQAEVFGEKE